MIEKLAEIEKTHQELTQRLTDPAIFSDPKAYRELNKTLSEIDPAVKLYREYVKVQKQRQENEELLQRLLEVRNLVLCGPRVHDLIVDHGRDLHPDVVARDDRLRLEGHDLFPEVRLGQHLVYDRHDQG